MSAAEGAFVAATEDAFADLDALELMSQAGHVEKLGPFVGRLRTAVAAMAHNHRVALVQGADIVMISEPSPESIEGVLGIALGES